MITNRYTSTFAALLVAGSLVGACKRAEVTDPAKPNVGELARRDLSRAGEQLEQGAHEAAERAARATQAGPTRTDFRAALGEIARARCTRESRCNNVGEGRRYMNDQACRTVLLNDFSRDLNPTECTAGIDRDELNECMRDIQAEDSNNPLDTISRVAACRTSDLCRNTTVSLH